MREDDGWERPEDAPVLVDKHDSPVEQDDLISAEDGMVCLRTQALPQPLVPTKAQIEAHEVGGHLPYRNWCRWCVMARRRNSQHRSQPNPSRRALPLMVADYCFMRDSTDEELCKTLVAKVYPAKALLATVVDSKGLSKQVIERVARFIKETGYLSFAYKSDQEGSIRAMLDAAMVKAGR